MRTLNEKLLRELYAESQGRDLPPEIAERAGRATLNPSSLKFLRHIAEKLSPRNILEFGSGLSTKLLTDFCPGEFHVFSVDNSDHFLAETLGRLSAKEKVTALHAPLELFRDSGRWFVTYGKCYLSSLPASVEFDLVLVDGPLGFFQREAPLYQIAPRISKQGLVLLDDSHRTYEEKALRNWLRRWPSLQMVKFGPEEPLTAILGLGEARREPFQWPFTDRAESYARSLRRLFYLWNHRRKGNAFRL
jgi:predicted O-methyltransferase YrrM